MVESMQKLVQNEMFVLFARICMVITTVVILPVALGFGGWFGNRIITNNDRLVADVTEVRTQQQLLQQSFKFTQDANSSEQKAIQAQVSDHEGRIRLLEADRRPH